MDKEYLFYIKLLGLNENFTQSELKAAYRQCAVKYHPDKYINAPEFEKQHAIDIMKQINEAYEYLKNNDRNEYKEPNTHQNEYKNNKTSNNEGLKGRHYGNESSFIFEEEIFNVVGKLRKYSLSNSLNEISKAIYRRTGYNIRINEEIWKPEWPANVPSGTWEAVTSSIEDDVKNLMNKYNVSYSMVTWTEPSYMPGRLSRHIILYRKLNNKWFTYGGAIIGDKFESYDEINMSNKQHENGYMSNRGIQKNEDIIIDTILNFIGKLLK